MKPIIQGIWNLEQLENETHSTTSVEGPSRKVGNEIHTAEEGQTGHDSNGRTCQLKKNKQDMASMDTQGVWMHYD